jgi:hypothetical protein
MDDGAAFQMFTKGQPVSLIIEGRREEGAMVTRLNVSSGHPTTMDLLLRTPIGERDRRVRVPISKVELAPQDDAELA